MARKKQTILVIIIFGFFMALIQFTNNSTPNRDSHLELKVFGSDIETKEADLVMQLKNNYPQLLMAQNFNKSDLKDRTINYNNKNDSNKLMQIQSLLNEYKVLQSKVLKNKKEEQLYLDSRSSTYNIDSFASLLDKEVLSQITNANELRKTFMGAVDFLVDALNSPNKEVALSRIKKIIENPDVENKNLDKNLREVLAQSKALLILYSYNDLVENNYDVLKSSPGSATVNIFKNVIERNKFLNDESKKIITQLESNLKPK